MAALIALHAQTGFSHFLVFLFQQVVKLSILLASLVQPVEEPHQQQHQYDGHHYGGYHPVQLFGLVVQYACAGLQFTVLACLLLQVYIDVAIIVALGFVVYGRIGHRQLFANAGHQVGSLMDKRVGQRLVQILQGAIVVAHGVVAGGQGTVGTGYLVDVAVGRKQLQR